MAGPVTDVGVEAGAGARAGAGAEGMVTYRPTGPGESIATDDVDPTVGSVIGRFDVLPRDLRRHLAGARHLDITDIASFPFDDLSEADWDLPLTVTLPDLALDDLIALHGSELLSRLGLFDLVRAPVGLRDGLIRTYGWPRSMFVADDYHCDPFRQSMVELVEREVIRRRKTRSIIWPLPEAGLKRRHRVLAAAVRRAAVTTPMPVGAHPVVDLLGWHVGTWIPVLWSHLRTVAERRPAALERLLTDYPSSPDSPPLKPIGGRSVANGRPPVDAAVGVRLTSQPASPVEDYRSLFERVRGGGRLVLVEQVSSRYRPDDLIDLLLEATTGRVVLHDVELIKTSTYEVADTAVFTLTKIGTQ